MDPYKTPYCFFASKKSEDKDGEKEFDDDSTTQDYIVKLPQLVPENPEVPRKSKLQEEIDAALRKYLDDIQKITEGK